MSGSCFSEFYLYWDKSCHSVKIMKQCDHCSSSPSLLKQGNLSLKIHHSALMSKYLYKILNVQDSVKIATCLMYRKFVSWERRNDFLPFLPVLQKLGLGCGMWWHTKCVVKLCFSTKFLFFLSFWLFRFCFLKQ